MLNVIDSLRMGAGNHILRVSAIHTANKSKLTSIQEPAQIANTASQVVERIFEEEVEGFLLSVSINTPLENINFMASYCLRALS